MLPTQGGLFYGGNWHSSALGQTIPVFDPSNGDELGTVTAASAVDVHAAVMAAAQAFPNWRDTTVNERTRALRQAAALVREHAEELATIDALDTGNPYTAMLEDAQLCADLVDYFAGLATEVHGATIPVGPDVLNYTLREPIGVVVRIGAFNHPFLFSAGKAGAALAAGCTLIIKPAELTPLSSLRLAELWKDVFPPGVFNVLTGGRDTGTALVEHPRVAKVGFIGSVEGGRAVMKAAAGSLKRVSLELGGKNALIACEDADPAQVADGIVRGINFTSVTSQSCNSTSRVYLHEAIHDAVLPELVDRMARIKMGVPTKPETEMGCLSSKAQFDKTMNYIKLAGDEGAKLLYGGKRPLDVALSKGFYVEPTAFTEVTDTMRIAREEVFGPVVSILKWSDESDVIKRVNALDVGLTGSVWTKDLSRAHRLASAIQSGYLWINDASVHYLGVPFGGYKQSGIGKEESFEELLECTQVKNVIVNLRPRVG
jgi:betaine-aldehyde dehydrogenase